METTLVEKKSTHKAEVVPVVLDPHPNADSLSIVKVYGYQVCAKTEDWKDVGAAVYIVPDSLVDVRRPEFSFLAQDANTDGKARIKAKKLRGVVSYGLLVPAPAGAKLGDDLAEQLGVERYEPPEPGQSQKDKFVIGGEEEAGPPIDTGPTVYDVDAFEKFCGVGRDRNPFGVFEPGEPVVLTEKLDGSNVRYVYWAGRYWVKSRKRWVKRVPDYSHVTVESLTKKGVPQDKAEVIVAGIAKKPATVNGFWQALEKNPGLMEFLMKHPGTTVYGEVYGTTNRLKYGLPDGNRFAAFDIYRDGRFLDIGEALSAAYLFDFPWVPTIGGDFPDEQDPGLHNAIRYSFEAVKKHAEGGTTVDHAKAGVIREGVVVKPLAERWDRKLGRVILKCVSPDFLGMKG